MSCKFAPNLSSLVTVNSGNNLVKGGSSLVPIRFTPWSHLEEHSVSLQSQCPTGYSVLVLAL